MESNVHKHHHHILPTKAAVAIGGTLLVLTGVTVWVAHIDLGPLNFVVAMAVASVKASLVALFFMNLKYDRRENAVIFITSVVFLAIFLVLTATDLFFRGDVYVKGDFFKSVQARSTLKKPWLSTPELVAKGKELFHTQCASCHGEDGKGNGPAAGALNPQPRNFTSTEGWKNGRRPTMVFKTLKEGLPPSAMASYATLPSDERWALVHYVLSLAPNPEKDTAQDFAKMGIDPTKDTVESVEAPSIPIEVAMYRMAVPPAEGEAHAKAFHQVAPGGEEEPSRGVQVYQAHCIQCHGESGQGGIRVKNLGVFPAAYAVTRPFASSMASLKSQDAFSQLVIHGMPGDLMPANAQLSGSDLKDLYDFVKKAAR